MTIKNITKKLVDAGYSEEKLILMTEKEIRETYKNYKSSPKEDDSILSSPNTTPENNDNAMDKEETTMTNEIIKVTVKVEGLNEVLTRYGIELICSNPSDADTIAIGQTPSQRRKGIVAVIITQTPSQYRKGIATMTIREDVYKTIEKDLSIVSNNSTTSVVKKEITMRNEMIKEMKELARKYDAFTHCIDDCRQREEAEKRNKVLDVKFVEIANKMGINATANDLYEIISNDYDSFDEAIEAYIKSHEVKVVSTTLTQENGELTFVELSPEQKIQISAVLGAQLQDVNYSSWFEEENGIFKLYTAWVDEDPAVEEEYYFDDNNKLIKVEVEKEESTMKTRTTQELINDALNITKIQDENYVTNAMLREEYKKLTGNVIGSKKTRPVIIKAIQDELHKEPVKPAPNDAEVLTYRLMHMIGDHALTNRKKGFGTTISAKMLCAFIVEVASSNDPEPIDKLYVPTGKKDKYGKPITMVNPKITEEHKNKCKDVRKWLIDNHYIETVTFKDEKGFVFYTPEYDGNRKDKMYDCTKFQATGKVETTTYRVTKEMNKWYK